MNVDVHDLCRHVDIQHVKRILPFHEITHVRIGNRRGNRRIDDISSVEKHALIRFVRLGEILIPDIASDTDSVFFRVYLITFFQCRSAVNADESFFFPAAEGLENLFPVNEITKGDIRTIQNKPRDKIGDVGFLRFIRFEKSQPHGRIEKEHLYSDVRPVFARSFGNLAEFPPVRR